MRPELFEIAGFPIRSFGVLLLLGFALGTWLAVRRSERYGISKDAITSLAIWAVFMGILGSRVFWVLQEWGFYSQNPGDILKFSEGGMTSYGGITFALLTVVLWCRKHKVRFGVVLDLLAAPALVMHAFGRIGCFLNGCCYGSPCDLPWAVTVHPESGAYYLGHPAQLYDTLMSLAGAGLLLWIEGKTFTTRRPGTYGALFFIFYGIARYIYEMFRSGYSSESTWGVPMTDAQIMALGMVAIGVVWLLVLARRRAPDPPPPNGGGTSLPE